MNKFAIIGLGAFGVRMLEELLHFTDEVIIIDKDLQKNSISFEVDKQITMEEIFNSLDDKENIYDIKIENEDFSKILLNYYKDKKPE